MRRQKSLKFFRNSSSFNFLCIGAKWRPFSETFISVLVGTFLLNPSRVGLFWLPMVEGVGGDWFDPPPLLRSLMMMLFTWKLVHLFFDIKGRKWWEKNFQNGCHFLMGSSKYDKPWFFMINTTNFQVNTTRAFRKILGRNITLLMIVYKFFIRLPWNRVPK